LDQTILKPTIIEVIVGTIPSESEEKSLNYYEGSLEELANPDKYLLVLMSVVGYNYRLLSLKFMVQSKNMVHELNVRIKALKNSFTFIIEDTNLKTFL
jgi:archaellum component FlaC